MLHASQSFVFIQRRWMSSNDTTAANIIGTQNTSSIRWISRRLFLQYQQHIKSKSSSKSSPSTKTNITKDETPWPRNFVYGTYVVLSICIPYSIAWFLSSNEPIRTMIFPFTKYYESSFIIEWMRHHFGIPDNECIAEPEIVQRLLCQQPIPYRFVDEPTKRIRQQQLYIDQQHERNIKFRLVSGTATPMESIHVVDLPANTLARYESLVKAVVPNNIPIQPPIALDFDNDDDDEEEVIIDLPSLSNFDDNNNTLTSLSSSSSVWNDTTITVPSMSIYSLWHYQPSKQQLDHANDTTMKLSPIQMELSRIQYELDILHQELKQQQLTSMQLQRPIDDIQDEIVKLKILKRQLQWRKWLSW